MNVRIIIGILGILLALPLINSLEIGQIITQEQLNNTDIWNVNLECSNEGLELVHEYVWRVRFNYQCFQIEPLIEGETYNITYFTTHTDYSFPDIRSCIQEDNPLGWCLRNRVVPYFIGEVRSTIYSLRLIAESYQDETLVVDLDDINITDDDL